MRTTIEHGNSKSEHAYVKRISYIIRFVNEKRKNMSDEDLLRMIKALGAEQKKKLTILILAMQKSKK